MVDLSTNKIKELTDMPQPRLVKVNLSENEISTAANFSGHPNLNVLELKKNKLVNCAGIANMRKLQQLNLSENEITSVKDMKNLHCLTKLDLSNNKLESFDNMPDLPALEHLILAGNPIEKDGELVKLKGFSALKSLDMAGCAWADEKGDDFKKEVLIALEGLKIKTVNGEDLTEDDFADAKEEKANRIAAAKEAAEEAARLAAEKAENPDAEGEDE